MQVERASPWWLPHWRQQLSCVAQWRPDAHLRTSAAARTGGCVSAGAVQGPVAALGARRRAASGPESAAALKCGAVLVLAALGRCAPRGAWRMCRRNVLPLQWQIPERGPMPPCTASDAACPHARKTGQRLTVFSTCALIEAGLRNAAARCPRYMDASKPSRRPRPDGTCSTMDAHARESTVCRRCAWMALRCWQSCARSAERRSSCSAPRVVPPPGWHGLSRAL